MLDGDESDTKPDLTPKLDPSTKPDHSSPVADTEEKKGGIDTPERRNSVDIICEVETLPQNKPGSRVHEREHMARLFPGKPCHPTKPQNPLKAAPAPKQDSTKYSARSSTAADVVKKNLGFLTAADSARPPPGGFDILGNIMSGMGHSAAKKD